MTAAALIGVLLCLSHLLRGMTDEQRDSGRWPARRACLVDAALVAAAVALFVVALAVGVV